MRCVANFPIQNNRNVRPRKYVGFGTAQDEKGASILWYKVMDSALHITTPKHMATAAVAGCHNATHFLNRFNNADIPNTSDIINAGYCADSAVTLGSTAPAVLAVAQRYHQILAVADQLIADPEALRSFKEHAANVTALWGLSERRMRAMNREKEEQAAKEGRRPNAYQCAQEGCPITATAQAALKRCGGPCPEVRKPTYCSRECQKAVRVRTLCSFTSIDSKPGLEDPQTGLHAPQQDVSGVGGHASEEGVDNASITSRTQRNRKKKVQKKQKELRVKLSGSDLVRGAEVFSSTLGADEMREFHAAVAEASLARTGRQGRSAIVTACITLFVTFAQR